MTDSANMTMPVAGPSDARQKQDNLAHSQASVAVDMTAICKEIEHIFGRPIGLAAPANRQQVTTGDPSMCPAIRGLPPKAYREGIPSTALAAHWARLWPMVCHPVEEAVVGAGLRAVRVMGHIVLIFLPNGEIRSVAWAQPHRKPPRYYEVPAGSVALEGDYWQRRWLNRLHERTATNYGIASVLQARYKDWECQTFLRRLAMLGELQLMQERIADALALNAQALGVARQTLPPLGSHGNLTVAQYNMVISRLDEFEQLQEDAPKLLAVYSAISKHLNFPAKGEPVQRLKRHLRNEGLSPRGWKMVLSLRTCDLRFIYEFYQGNIEYALYDNLMVLDALGLYQHQPRWLLAAAFSIYGSAARPCTGYRISMREDGFLSLVAHVARLYIAGQVGATARDTGELSLVMNWFASLTRDPLSRAQRQRGWPFLVEKARQWEEQSRLCASSSNKAWSVPFVRMRVDDYRLRALSNAYELWLEGRRMRNCVGSYAPRCELQEVLLVAVSKNGKPIATAQYLPSNDGWKLSHALGAGNTKVGGAVMRVLINAEQMIAHRQDPPPVTTKPEPPMKATFAVTEEFQRELAIRPIDAIPGDFHMEFTSQLFSAKDPRAKRRNFDVTVGREDLRRIRALIDDVLSSPDLVVAPKAADHLPAN